MAKNALFAFAALLLLSPCLFADQLGDDLSDFSSALDAQVSVENTALAESPQVMLAKITAKNPQDSPMPLYVIKEEDGGWEVAKLLGQIPPRSKSSVELEIEVHYEKESSRNTRYAIVGRGEDGELYGMFFEVSEDWSAYEKSINESLSAAMLSIVPILGTVLVVLLAIMAQTAYRSKSRGLDSGEYTMKTLVFPEVEGRPLEERIADVMINPVIMLTEIACVGILVLIVFEGMAGPGSADSAIKVMLLSALGAFSIPFLYFAAAWYFEKREEGKPLRFFAGIFVWGMFSAFFSLLISSSIAGEMKAYMLASYAIVATMLVSPVVEEFIKGLGVLFMSGHHEYNDTLTGLLLGFTCGAGFAFVENWFYFSSKANPFDIGLAGWSALILYRSFFNTLAHGCFTASISTVIGYIRGVDRLQRFARLAFIPGVFIAVAVHALFNLSAIADGFVIAKREALFFIFNPMLIILLVAMFFLVLVLAVIDEKKRRVKLLYPLDKAAQENAQGA